MGSQTGALGSGQAPGPQRETGTSILGTVGDWGSQGWQGARSLAGQAGQRISSATDAVNEWDVKVWIKMHAWEGSYLMTFMGSEGGGTVAGQFLRMYLRHELDDDVVKAGGKIIVASGDYNEFEVKTFRYLQDLFLMRFTGKKPTNAEVEAFAKNEGGKYVKEIRRSKGIAFRSDGANAIIGGVGVGVEVRSASVKNKGVNAAGFTVYEVVLQVNYADSYDFDNERSGDYDRYRKELASMLFAKRYFDFRTKVLHDELSPPYSLPRGHIFASFMYAIEQAHLTPGPLVWDITLPLRGTLMVDTPP